MLICVVYDPRRDREKMGELARKYVETRDKKLIEELYELACEFEKMEKESLD
jgi:hypothetical protein